MPDYFKIRTWVLVGPPKSGKSSTIGALISQTGRGGGGKRDVLLRGGGFLRIEAYRQSVQEAKVTPGDYIKYRISAARSQQRKAAFSYRNLLIALRTDNVNGLPVGSIYLSEFVKAGFLIESVVILCPNEYDEYATFGAPTCEIDTATDLARVPGHRGWLFGYVRNHFGWA